VRKDLSDAGQSWLDGYASFIAGDLADLDLAGRAVHLDLPGKERAWSHKAHVAGQDVQQLGYLIERDFTHEPSDAGDARVRFQRLEIHVLPKAGFSHGPEFKRRKKNAILAHAFLCDNGRAAIFENDRDPDQRP